MQHALCCIKEALEDLISGQEKLTVSCNKDTCWTSREVNEYGYCAANINIGSSRFQGDRKNRTHGPKNIVCGYDTVLPIDIEIYALQCDDSFCKATAASAFVMQKYLANDSGLPVRRVRPTGESFDTTNRGDIEFTLVTIQLELDYFFSPEQPWLLWKGQ